MKINLMVTIDLRFLHIIIEMQFIHPRYEQVRFLERGGCAEVSLCRDLATGELAALKFIPRAQVQRNGSAEAEVLNHMRLRNHPHIIHIKEVFLTETHLVLALEYAPGGNLLGLVGGGLPEHQARWLFGQVLFGLDYCHRMGVASRDVKLENCLLMDTNERPLLKLADFGLSTEVKSSCSLGETATCGTPTYFAPEIVLNQAYDAKGVDVWSAGVLLLALLTGSCPFQRASDSELPGKDRVRVMLQRILLVDYVMPLWVSGSCKDLITKMLVADPRQRISVRDALQHPWLADSIQVGAMLQFNDAYVSESRAAPPAAELVQEVKSILQEAAMGPPLPPINVAQVSGSAPAAPLTPSVLDSQCESEFDLLMNACEYLEGAECTLLCPKN